MSSDVVIHDYQKNYFATFGYLQIPAVFAATEMSQFRQALSALFEHTTITRSERLTPLYELNPEVFDPLLDDERLLAIAEGLLGADCLFTGANDGNYYVGNTPWHIDGGSPDADPMIKITCYCESLTAGQGCLCVIPGSHHPEFFKRLYHGFYTRKELDIQSAAIPGATFIPSCEGDVIVFDHRLWHSAWGGRNGRLQFAWSFASFPKDSWQETYLQGYLTRYNQRQGRRMLTQRLFDQATPKRRRKIAKLYEMGL